jgi:RNA polymerase sigma-70 factor (ECF subfamily)
MDVAADLEALYRRRYATFRHVVARQLGSEGAHDAVQEGFARAYARRSTYRGEGTLEAWVWRIVLRTAQETAGRPRELELDVDAAPAPPAGSAAGLADAVRRLPPRRRLVVFLRFFAGLSYAEIAQATGMAEGTVAATLAHARADLAAALGREEVAR